MNWKQKIVLSVFGFLFFASVAIVPKRNSSKDGHYLEHAYLVGDSGYNPNPSKTPITVAMDVLLVEWIGIAVIGGGLFYLLKSKGTA